MGGHGMKAQLCPLSVHFRQVNYSFVDKSSVQCPLYAGVHIIQVVSIYNKEECAFGRNKTCPLYGGVHFTQVSTSAGFTVSRHHQGTTTAPSSKIAKFTVQNRK